MASDLDYKKSKLNGKADPRSGMKASRTVAMVRNIIRALPIENLISDGFGRRKAGTVQLQNEMDDKGRRGLSELICVLFSSPFARTRGMGPFRTNNKVSTGICHLGILSSGKHKIYLLTRGPPVSINPLKLEK